MRAVIRHLRLAAVGALARLGEPVSFPGKYRLLSALAPAEGHVRTRIHGASIELDISELNQRYIWLRTHYRREVRLMRRLLVPGRTMFDVGANAGFYTLAAARIVGPSGRVVAFEPNPAVRTRLQKTISENQLKHVRVEAVALSDRNETAELRGAAEEDHNATATLTGTPDMPIVATVRCQSLDDFCRQTGIDRIDYLKIDVDGAEQRVLAGARQLIESGRIGALQIEFCDYWLRHQGTTPVNFDAHLRDLGFQPLAGQPPFRDGEIIDRFYRWRG